MNELIETFLCSNGSGLLYKKIVSQNLGPSLKGGYIDATDLISDQPGSNINLGSSYLQDVVSASRCNSAQLPSQKDIASILTDIQLDQYIDTFTGQEVDNEMLNMGIVIFGHRKRILTAINRLKD